MKYQVMVGGEVFRVEVDGGRVTVNGIERAAELRAIPGTPMRLLLLDHASWVLPMSSNGGSSWEIVDAGERLEVEVVDERTAHIRSLVGAGVAPAGPAVLKAPMPGLVTRIHVVPGQDVAAGASLLTLEAMKMENDLRAVGPGIVDTLQVSAGATVEKGAILVTFRAGRAPAAPGLGSTQGP